MLHQLHVALVFLVEAVSYAPVQQVRFGIATSALSWAPLRLGTSGWSQTVQSYRAYRSIPTEQSDRSLAHISASHQKVCLVPGTLRWVGRPETGKPDGAIWTLKQESHHAWDAV